jgi:hypothetical protein
LKKSWIAKTPLIAVSALQALHWCRFCGGSTNFVAGTFARAGSSSTSRLRPNCWSGSIILDQNPDHFFSNLSGCIDNPDKCCVSVSKIQFFSVDFTKAALGPCLFGHVLPEAVGEEDSGLASGFSAAPSSSLQH